jgi:M6 family metalloprotease-like protein
MSLPSTTTVQPSRPGTNRSRAWISAAFGRGRAATRAGLLAALAILALALSMTGARVRPAHAQAAPGTPSPVVNLLCKYSDRPAEPRTPAQMQAKFANQFGGMDHYFREVSDGAINLTGTQTRGWYTLPQPKSAYEQGADMMGDCAAAADADVNFQNFRMVNMFFNEPIGLPTGGVAWNIGRDGVTSIAYTRIPAAAGHHLVAHEMVHAFGLYYIHSTNDPYDIISDPHAYTSAVERGEPFGLVGQGPIAPNRNNLGWIAAARKVSHGAGSRQVTLQPLSQSGGSGLLMAEIPFGSTGLDFYTAEYRRKVGYDQGLPAEGVVIHRVTETELQGMYFLDSVTVATVLSQGQTFSGDGGLTIRVDTLTPSGATLTINRTGPAPVERPSSLPKTPTNLHSTGNTTTSISLAWEAPQRDDHTFRLEMRPGWNGDAVTVFYGDSNLRAATISWLTEGQTYEFRIKSCIYQSTTCSAYSQTLTTGTAGSPAVAAPPVPTNFRSTGQAATSIDLAWDAPAAGDVSFEIRFHNGSGWVNHAVAGTQRTATISGLQTGPQYEFTIRACRGATCSDASAPVVARTVSAPAPAAPAVPVNFRSTMITSVDTITARITLAWDDPGAPAGTTYNVQMRMAGSRYWGDLATNITAGTATSPGLAKGETHHFRVQSCRNTVCSEFTQQLNVTIPPPGAPAATPTPTPSPAPAPMGSAPATPANLRSPGSTTTSLAVAWDASSGTVTGYKVQYRLYNGATWNESSVAGTQLSTTITGLSLGTWYEVRVAACNGSQCSGFTAWTPLITAAG